MCGLYGYMEVGLCGVGLAVLYGERDARVGICGVYFLIVAE